MISAPVFSSNAPVGSSAKIIFGFFYAILAIETRCACPPDSSYILDFSKSESNP